MQWQHLSGTDHAPRTDRRRGGALCPPRAVATPAAWTRAAYETAMRASGRPVSLTDAQFDAIQKRKPAAMKRIEAYLKDIWAHADPARDGRVPGGAARVFPLPLFRAPGDAGRRLRGAPRSPGRWAMARRCRTISARPT